MPIIKSAKKRVRVSTKATIRNAKTKRTLRESVKAFHLSLTTGKADKIAEAQNKAVSAIDVAAKKNVLHKNKAARKKSQLATAVKTNSTKPATVKKAIKKAPAKKPVKPVAKKTAK